MITGAYDDESLLPLSGIQHFAFCERQWALIHVEKQWAENVRTVEGRQLHERVDDPYFTEKRNNIKVVRSVPLVSRRLGLYGVADLIEYEHNSAADRSPKIRIVEYKRGKPKPDERDEVQLCAQAMCLEEMLGIKLDYAYFYYGETRHRHRVDFHEKLREKVEQLTGKMHELFEKGITPPPVKSKKCKCCSLNDLCLPVLGKKTREACRYIDSLIAEIESESAGD
ncbi:CRISPR-associated protein Cas4 [Thermincola potens]|uniref:CRISPR-associated exonuclease Cas4 n=1 Tax=Thermincola potens (strain JR) TaxID=635013 RepID=D5X815_THEPJ|nr:CRISPR-associated protein Cas4 [Thermincola potens]ADG82735.1 CRISPR-associated protein Cas4 [Thermincola potens JR]